MSRGTVWEMPEVVKHLEWIFDFTASNPLNFNQLVKEAIFDCKIKVCRAQISDFGNLGVIYFEGSNRNPRVDDLQSPLSV